MASTPRQIWIIDTTLRDGEQAPGIVFQQKDKLMLAQRLSAAGVDELEVGIPAMGRDECQSIEAMVRANFDCRLTSWCRARREDITLAARCQTAAVHISFPVSELHLNALGLNPGNILSALADLLPFARHYFDYVSIGAQDATRATPEFLQQFVKKAFENGAHRLRLADTVGVATPWQVKQLVGECLGTLNRLSGAMEIEFHAHNDLGMATANALSAIEAGAHGISLTVNGLGERAGNAALEEVVTALRLVTPFKCRVDLNQLNALCQFTAFLSRRPIPPAKPITGASTFKHESGIHCRALINDPRTYEPFAADIVGHGPSEFIIGKHSGQAGLSHVLQKMGISVDEAILKQLLEKVKSAAIANGRPLNRIELLSIVT